MQASGFVKKIRLHVSMQHVKISSNLDRELSQFHTRHRESWKESEEDINSDGHFCFEVKKVEKYHLIFVCIQR